MTKHSVNKIVLKVSIQINHYRILLFFPMNQYKKIKQKNFLIKKDLLKIKLNNKINKLKKIYSYQYTIINKLVQINKKNLFNGYIVKIKKIKNNLFNLLIY